MSFKKELDEDDVNEENSIEITPSFDASVIGDGEDDRKLESSDKKRKRQQEAENRPSVSSEEDETNVALAASHCYPNQNSTHDSTLHETRQTSALSVYNPSLICTFNQNPRFFLMHTSVPPSFHYMSNLPSAELNQNWQTNSNLLLQNTSFHQNRDSQLSLTTNDHSSSIFPGASDGIQRIHPNVEVIPTTNLFLGQTIQSALLQQQLASVASSLLRNGPTVSLAHPEPSIFVETDHSSRATLSPFLRSPTQNEQSSKQIVPRSNLPEQTQSCLPLCLSMSIDEDQNWLSEYYYFVRSELIEVFQATCDYLETRKSSKTVFFQQIGIRCRYCAHSNCKSRPNRSSAFPSCIGKLYQSFTMMVRDHFAQCPCVPESIKTKVVELKSRGIQSDANSRDYWIYSAKMIGLIDTANGIMFDETAKANARREQPFGTSPGYTFASNPPILFVTPEDRGRISESLYTLMSEVQLVYMLPSEQFGCRHTYRIGMSGLGCRQCSHVGRLGMSRVFPTRRGALELKMNDLFVHIERCKLCPPNTREVSKNRMAFKLDRDKLNQEKIFFDRVWKKLQ